MSTNCNFRKNIPIPSLFLFLCSYAAYLEERVGCAINQAGKLEHVTFNSLEFGCYEEKSVDMVFRKFPKCQAFVDMVLDCSPNDTDNLAQTATANTLKESFQVYIMFCTDNEILINMFFDLTRPARALACDILKNLEYPSVQIITMDHVLAMEQCFTYMKTPPPPNETQKEGK